MSAQFFDLFNILFEELFVNRKVALVIGDTKRIEIRFNLREVYDAIQEMYGGNDAPIPGIRNIRSWLDSMGAETKNCRLGGTVRYCTQIKASQIKKITGVSMELADA